MLDETIALPEDPEELRAFTARLLAEVKAQAVLIEKLRHQLAGHARHRFGASSETAEQLQLALETSEIAAAPSSPRRRGCACPTSRRKAGRSAVRSRTTSRGWKWSSAPQLTPVPTAAAGCAGSART